MGDAKAFKDVIAQASFPRYLLLGNGFSRACGAGFGSDEIRKKLGGEGGFQCVLDEFEEDDPEQILRVFEDATRMIGALDECADGSVEKKLREKMEDFKKAFITAIAELHPKHQTDIGDEKFTACREFLANFLGEKNKDGAVYTLNYDLLLLWAIMGNYDLKKLATNDGFEPKGDILQWTDKERADRRSIYYLHGALSFYAKEAQLYKHRWKDGTILDQVKDALKKGEMPLFIAGGTDRQKEHDIQQVPYLKTAHERFKVHMGEEKGCLFLYGVSLSDNDRHIWNHIINGNIPHLYVGLYGDDRAKVKGFAEYMKEKRSKKTSLEVTYFCAESASVWGTPQSA